MTGKLTDSKGQPIPGVSVYVKGTTSDTITGVDGFFSLPVDNTATTLVFTFVGMTTQEVPLAWKNHFEVHLLEDVIGLEELVVVGYGTMERKEVTSAVKTVSEKDFNLTGSSDPMELIQGKVPGLVITRTKGSNPNSSSWIQLRGVTSLTRTREPLIVIDGIPGGNLDMIQIDGVESFSVLKDGSAAAIYGSRANAGVILGTTKKGKSGAPHFDYSTYFKREFVDKKPAILFFIRAIGRSRPTK